MQPPCRFRPFLAVALLAACTAVAAQTASNEQGKPGGEDESLITQQERSPWLLVPLVSSNPKLGTSIGGMGGYIKRFDPVSEPSLLALQATVSNTSSKVLGLGGKLYFNENRDRATIGLVGGKVSNDYLDFLGSGLEVATDEQMRAYFLRYQHEVAPRWYLGVQGVHSNYNVDGVDPTSELILDEAGITGLVSAGLGLVLAYDSRDNVNNPTDGLYALVHNVTYRESLGSDADYDALIAEARWYLRTQEKNVLVLHAKGRWTANAPSSRESTIEMRGYNHGQYLGRHMTTLEAEDRYQIGQKWGAKGFGGLACLYGDGKSCELDKLYPMIGVGAFYVIKPKEHMVINAEFAKGKSDNQGFYLRFGNRF
ncbi:BamA/TamA family outer membrane protein [Niveibacterium sp. SC-1]|uniref:BamA/TamA family outer membrane protein n=1 Tax=Niveibacterium sp. SC-1 TaxID=3135646 RepID=UPI00311E60CC